KDLKQRRSDEMEMLTYLTGKNYNDWDLNTEEESVFVPEEASYGSVSKLTGKKATSPIIYAAAGFAGMLLLIGFRRRTSPRPSPSEMERE
ncbi:MAG TPA: hypothetical protein VER36_12710, partial [Flavisolibacter sp.]|nr:hypothetical protein [Flavisolibacter sp.]